MLIPIKEQWGKVNDLADLANFVKELGKYTVTFGYCGFPRTETEALHQNNIPLVKREVIVVPGSNKRLVAAISVGTLGFAIGYFGGTALTNTPLIAGVGLGLALGVIAYKAWLEKRTTYERVEVQDAEILMKPEENPEDNLPLKELLEETVEPPNETPLSEEKDQSEDSSKESGDDEPSTFPKEIPPFDFSKVNQGVDRSESGSNRGENTLRKKELPSLPSPKGLPPQLPSASDQTPSDSKTEKVDELAAALSSYKINQGSSNQTLKNYQGPYEVQIKKIDERLEKISWDLEEGVEKSWIDFTLQLVNGKIKAKAAQKTLEAEKGKIDTELYEALESLVNAVAQGTKEHKKYGAFAKSLNPFRV